MDFKRVMNNCVEVSLTARDSTSVPGMSETEKSAGQMRTTSAIVAGFIAIESLPEIFGLLGLISDRETQEKLLTDLPLLPWYPPDPSAGGIWREE